MARYVDGRKIISLGGPLDANAYAFNNAYEAMRSILWQGSFATWAPHAEMDKTVVGSGVGNGIFNHWQINTGVTQSSQVRYTTPVYGLNEDAGGRHLIDWAKAVAFGFTVVRLTAGTAAVAYVQLKVVTTWGDMADKGIGIKISNFTMVGESYGSSQAVTATIKTMTTAQPVRVVIILYPGSKIEWYVGGTLVVTQSTAAKIPSTTSAATFLWGIDNGDNGGGVGLGDDASIEVMHPFIWQERS